MPRDPRADPLIERAKLRCPGCRIAWRLDGWKHRSPANSECVAKEERAELRAIAKELRENERERIEMKRALQAVVNGVIYLGTMWWAGVVFMTTGVDITEPAEENHAD